MFNVVTPINPIYGIYPGFYSHSIVAGGLPEMS